MSNREFGPRVLEARFSLSCVVPVLNEGAQIGRFLDSLHQAIDPLANVEIVVVNDGSTDNSAMN